VLVDSLFPVGAVYLTVGNTNPGTLLGHGTWGQIAQGRFLAGVGQGTDSEAEQRTMAAGNTGGTYSHALTEAELAAHSHALYARDDDGTSGSVNGFAEPLGGGAAVAGEVDGTKSYITQNALTTQIVQDTGSGTAHENTPPGFGVYVWQRTA
jgi:microcystin-dependent protein